MIDKDKVRAAREALMAEYEAKRADYLDNLIAASKNGGYTVQYSVDAMLAALQALRTFEDHFRSYL